MTDQEAVAQLVSAVEFFINSQLGGSLSNWICYFDQAYVNGLFTELPVEVRRMLEFMRIDYGIELLRKECGKHGWVMLMDDLTHRCWISRAPVFAVTGCLNYSPMVSVDKLTIGDLHVSVASSFGIPPDRWTFVPQGY
jgi:hypothetical protein